MERFGQQAIQIRFIFGEYREFAVFPVFFIFKLLPNIYRLKSGKKTGGMVYCFKALFF